MKPLKERITPSFVVAVLALLLVVGGTGYAASKVTSRDIKNETIKSIDIKDRSLKLRDFSAAAKQRLQAQTFGYFYNLSAATVAVEGKVPFDTNGPATAGAFTHAAGGTDIIVVKAGVYEIEFSVSGVEANQFAVLLDGAVVPGSIYGSGAGTQQNNGRTVVAVPAGGVLSLVNHSSASAVTLQFLAGGTQENVNASMLIRKLA